MEEKSLNKVPANALSLVIFAKSGLKKMKPYKGTVYRGEALYNQEQINNILKKEPEDREKKWAEKKFKKNNHIKYKQFVSTSKQIYSSYIVKSKKFVALEIESKKGIDISAISNTLYEREVLFLPGTTFKIIEVEEQFNEKKNQYTPKGEPGRLKVKMEEVT